MDNAADRIEQWAKQVQEHQTVPWDALPEIYLYMDQVITYMEKQLHLFGREENSVLLTSSMINNYVKDGVLPRPDKKKYSREHLAMLTVICLLKQVLSIPDISSVLNVSKDAEYQRDIYESFRDAQASELAQVCARVSESAQQGEDELRLLASALSVEASARRIASERILSELERAKKKGNVNERIQQIKPYLYLLELCSNRLCCVCLFGQRMEQPHCYGSHLCTDGALLLGFYYFTHYRQHPQ